MDSIQSISNRKLPQSDYLLSDELKHHGKYYDEHLTKSTNNANINKQRYTKDSIDYIHNSQEKLKVLL